MFFKQKKKALIQIAPYYSTAGGGGGYTGPGDIYAFSAWYGVRGYSGSYAAPGTNPAIDIVDQAGANSLTVNILSNGNLDVASVSSWVSAHSVTTIMITKVYDQTGNGKHVVQTTLGNMPSLALNVIGSLPMMFAPDQVRSLVSSTSLTQSSPLTVSAVANRDVSVGGSFSFIIADNFTAGGFGLMNSANTAGIYSGGITVSLGSVADGSFHAMQFLSTTTVNTSTVSVDGTTATASGGAAEAGAWNGTIGLFANQGGSFNLKGYIGEAGIAGGNQTSHNAVMNSNQHSYWGF